MFRNLVVSLLFFCGSFTQAEETRIQFKQDSFSYDARVGETLTLSLPGLLSETGPGPRNWSASGLPGWLTLNNGAEELSGTPSPQEIGDFAFNLAVQQGESGAIARVSLRVIALPQWSVESLDLGIQNEDVAFEMDVAQFVTDPAGGALSFSASNLPAWMTLSPSGKITGTPRRKDVGAYTGITLKATGLGGSTSVQAYGEVLKTIKPPKWVSNPLSLENALEDSLYKKDLVSLVSNPEGAPLTFELLQTSWLQLSPAGSLLGTPGKSNLGKVSLVAKVSTQIEGKKYSDTTELNLEVLHVNHAPKFKQNPITLPNGFSGVTYSQDIFSTATDPDDGDTLSYTLISGPSWIQLSSSGKLSGTPDKSHVGSNRWTVKVADQDGLFAEAELILNVIKSNEPPFWISNPVVLPNAKEDFAYSQDLSAYVKDPDGDKLSFALLAGPDWLHLNESGIVTGTPQAKDVSLHRIDVRVTDNISGNAVVRVLIEVEHTNHAPFWVMSPIVFTVKEESLATLDLSPYAKDVDGDALQFILRSGPSWASLNGSGVMSGTPQMADEGDNEFFVDVQDPSGASEQAKVIVRVLHINHKPFWTQNPLVLPDAPEKQAYAQSVATFASDVDPNDVLTFSKVSGPAWAQVLPDGTLTGTPGRSDVGANSLQVRVMDKENEFAVATVNLAVVKVNTKPRWRQNPLLLSDAEEDSAYQFVLTPFAVDDDGDALSFSIVEGPAWLSVDAQGRLSGVPTHADVGSFETTLRAADGSLFADVRAIGKVLKVNHAPTVPAGIVLQVKERETLDVDLKQHIHDPDGDVLQYSLVNPADWMKATSEGILTLSPLFKNIGPYSLVLRVSDGNLYGEGVVRIEVLRDPRPPVWSQSTYHYEARTNEAFSVSLSDEAIDLDAIALQFSKVSGPEWLSVESNGQLQGSPTDANLGTNTFSIRVKNDVLHADATVIVTVVPGTHLEEIDTASPVAGARVDNVWIVDNSQFSYQLMQGLKTSIGKYYALLNEAGLHHKGILLSSDIPAFDGAPITGETGGYHPELLSWESPSIATDFNKRLAKAYTHNCYSSPIWAMLRFQQRVPGFSWDYEAHVPTEAILITEQRDHFAKFAKNTAFSSWNATDYADEYLRFHQERNKTFRMSAVAPQCPTLKENAEEKGASAPSNAYREVVNRTGGKYYTAECHYEMQAILKDFAAEVTRRAYVTAKKDIQLAKFPIETHTMEVTLGNQVLNGNSGSDDDQWRYNAIENTVEIFWSRIPSSQWSNGEKLRIKYRVS